MDFIRDENTPYVSFVKSPGLSRNGPLKRINNKRKLRIIPPPPPPLPPSFPVLLTSRILYHVVITL